MIKSLYLKWGKCKTLTPEVTIFYNFLKKRGGGITRIGTFGDSFTYGSEVKKDWSYPALLKKIFNKHFPEKKVEILNFGMKGHGFQQHFLVWKEYAEKYNIDYVLLGPEGAQPDRDITFTIPWASRSLLKHPKGRYILKEDGSLDFVNIKGDTFFERYKNYYTLYPSWMILKYDKLFLNLLKNIHFPFFDRQMQNPFYYSDLSTEEESIAINRILLREIKEKHHRKMMFLTSNKITYNLYKEEKGFLNLNYLSLFPQTPLYYRRYHYSTLGYEIWAKVFLKALTGNTEFSMKVFQCLTKKKDTITKQMNKIESLKEVFLYYKDLKIAVLDGLKFNHSSFRKAKSFIAFFNSSEHFMNGILLPVPFQLDSENRIFIKKDNEKLLLGYVFPLDERNVFFGFQKDYILTVRYHPYGFPDASYLLLDRLFSKKLSASNNIEKMELYIDNYKIADLKIENHKDELHTYKIIYPTRKNFFWLGEFKDSIRHEDLPEKINLSFKYINSENEVIDSSALGFPCVKKQKTIHIDLPNFDFL
ncbi:MAG: hypothetical protein OXJ52_00540 [Oligoflexia bacterium]|nr:hypothetical protein [Oligoflexia bacterium]